MIVRRISDTKHVKSVLIILVQSPTQCLQAINNLLSVLYRRNRNCSLADDPVQRDSCGALVDFGTDTLEFIDDRLDLVPIDVAKVSVAAWSVVTVIFSGQTAERDRAVCNDGDRWRC